MSKNMRINRFHFIAVSLLVLTACENAKKELGLERTAPDEFAVVRRAPLAMPPDYALRPPRPGAPRPQEAATQQQAATTVFGGQASNGARLGTGEQVLLQQAGADAARPDIRNVVDRETAAMPPAKQTAVKKILGLGKTQPPAASVVDAKAEAERLEKNAAQGKPVTAGKTPAKEE